MILEVKCDFLEHNHNGRVAVKVVDTIRWFEKKNLSCPVNYRYFWETVTGE